MSPATPCVFSACKPYSVPVAQCSFFGILWVRKSHPMAYRPVIVKLSVFDLLFFLNAHIRVNWVTR